MIKGRVWGHEVPPRQIWLLFDRTGAHIAHKAHKETCEVLRCLADTIYYMNQWMNLTQKHLTVPVKGAGAAWEGSI